MRGVVLLAVGVVLIWLGATTSRSTSDAADRGPASGEGAEAPAEGSPEVLSVSLDSGVGERAARAEPEQDAWLEPESDAESDQQVGAGLERGLDREADPGALATAEASEVDGGAVITDGPEESAPDLGEASAPVPVPSELPVFLAEARPRSSDDVGQEPLSFRLTEAGEDPAQLAVLLLESWSAADPSALEEYLNDTERDLTAARRRLVATFWQAAAGNPDLAIQAADELEGAEGVTTAQVALLRAAGDREPTRAVPAAVGRRDPLARAMRMVLLQDRAVRAEQAGEIALAARSWSDLIHLELDAEWPPHRGVLVEWAAGLNAVQARHRLRPDGDWPSLEVEVLPNDNLSEIRSRVVREHPRIRLSVDMLRRLNQIGKFIHPGDLLRVPLDEPNVLVDLDARLVVYRHGTEAVLAWECGIGKEGNETPPGIYQVGLRQEDPAYMPKGREAKPFGDEDNPLGTRWLAWHMDGENTSYGIHGTWEPEGVGHRVSQGCVRMRNEEVEALYELIPLGAQVIVQP